MHNNRCILHFTLAAIILFSSCSTLDKASTHGFRSGYYRLDSAKQSKPVYVDVNDDNIDVYQLRNKKPQVDHYHSFSLKASDSFPLTTVKFCKQSLDIDITTILLKYRPSVYDLPSQFTNDLNIALYAGWRFDSYKINTKTNLLGKRFKKISNLGYDVGIFTGLGTTQINQFTTTGRTTNEYNGMIVQSGIAGFLESNVASFGVAVGLDYLLNRDRDIWIYHKKPWIGFVVGIALN